MTSAKGIKTRTYRPALCERSTEIWEGKTPDGTSALERGRRRTRQDQISLEATASVKLRTQGTRTERRKPVSSARPGFFRNTIQPLT
jgi:hypothetical protein